MKERKKSGLFRVTGGRVLNVTVTEGGMSHDFDKGCHNSIFPYLSHSSVALPCHSASAAPKEQNRGGR